MVKFLLGMVVGLALFNLVVIIIHRVKQGKIKKWYGQNVDNKSR